MRLSMSSKHTLFSVGLLICLLCGVLPTTVTGQRAAVSLGKRLQQRFGSRRGPSTSDEYVVEGERNNNYFQYCYRGLLKLSSSSSSSSEMDTGTLTLSAAVVTIIMVLVVGLLLRLLNSGNDKDKAQETDDDGEYHTVTQLVHTIHDPIRSSRVFQTKRLVVSLSLHTVYIHHRSIPLEKNCVF
jgi:hypothetical protein